MAIGENNVRFNYLYRDADNFKLFGSEVFANPDHLPLSEISDRLTAALIDGEFFDPVKWKIRMLSFPDASDEKDHSWNEFDSVAFTADEPTTTMSIGAFLQTIDALR